MLRNVAEALGFALAVAFLAFVWPPLALLGMGVLLVVWANFTKPAKPRPAGSLGATVAVAVAAARKAWAEASKAPSS